MARTPARPAATSTPSITTASRSHQQDINSRMARYALAMGIRTACFVLLFVVPWPWKWIVAAGAVVLPYVAVLIANAGRERLPVAWGSGQRESDVPSPHQPAPEASVEALMPVQVVRGETVEHDEAVAPQGTVAREGTVVAGTAAEEGAGRRADDEPPGHGHAA